mmetsp:Transcript_39635/g.122548  ORF Transcript_39635/g.122548 Transcript_39635/m.122548 type:complete len:722 (-) Transcript_39635:181-2346(-)
MPPVPRTPVASPVTASSPTLTTTLMAPGQYGSISVPADNSASAQHARLLSLNPFKYDHGKHRGPLQLVKMVLVGLVLFVPRVLILIVALVMMAIAAKCRLCCCPERPPEDGPRDPDGRPLPMPDRGGGVSMLFLRLGARLVLFAFGYWWISVDDRRTDADRQKGLRAPVLASNHVSFLDAFLFAYLDAPMGVGKSELFKIPIIGSIARATQMIGVSREDGKRAHSAGDEIKRRVRFGIDNPPDVVEEYGGGFPPLLIFPEATCTNSTCVIQFKLGAFAPLMAVQPVALDLRQSHLDASWVDAVSPAMTALRLMCQVFNKCTVTYLPVMHPPADKNVQSFALGVRKAIADALRVPVTQHNFLDILLAHEAHRLRLPRGDINVQMGQFDGDKAALDRVKSVLKEFAAIDSNKDGHIDEDEFAAVLGFDTEPLRVAHGTLIRAAFQHWDRDGDGRINFREYLLLSSAVKASKLTQQHQLAVRARKESASGGKFPAAASPPTTSPAEPLSPNQRQNSASSNASPSSTKSASGVSPFGDEVPGVAIGGVEGPKGDVRTALEHDEEEGAAVAGESALEPALRDAFALAFSAFDQDGDGVVMGSDVVKILRTTAPGVNVEQAQALFFAAAGVDPAGADGRDVSVSLPQFLRLCERHPMLVGSFLDAIAAVGMSAGPSAAEDPDDAVAVDDEVPDLAKVSRHNTFVAADEVPPPRQDARRPSVRSPVSA